MAKTLGMPRRSSASQTAGNPVTATRMSAALRVSTARTTIDAHEIHPPVIGSDPKVLVNHYLRFWMLDHIRTTDMRDFFGRGIG